MECIRAGGQAGTLGGSRQSLTRFTAARGGEETGQCAPQVGQGGCTTRRARARSPRLGLPRARSAQLGRLRRRMRAAPIDRRPRGAAPLKCSASRDASPGLGPQRWRRERAPPAASGGHAAMAREVTATRSAPSAASALLCNR